MSSLTGDEPIFEPRGICHLCARRKSPTRCDAFPEGIPREILTGDFDHRKSYPGDGGKRFVPRARP